MKLREGFGNSTGAWHVAICFVMCSVTRTRPPVRASSPYAAYAVRFPLAPPEKSKEYYFKTRYGVKA